MRGWTGMAMAAGLVMAPMTPMAAQAETTACDLLTRADVEAVTGTTVTKVEPGSLEICGGLCETLTGTTCAYSGTLGEVRQTVRLSFELPPYMVKDPFGLAEIIAGPIRNDHMAQITVGGMPGQWDFSPGESSLHVLDGNTAHFRIVQQVTFAQDMKTDGPLFDEAMSMQQAQALYARVWQHYQAGR